MLAGATPRRARCEIDTPLVKAEIAVAEIGLEDHGVRGGGIGRRIRVFRLPDENPHRSVAFDARGRVEATATTRSMCCVTQEDGHLVWSSPIYLFRQR